MRDPNRIESVLKRIGTMWSLCPDLRLGQLLVNSSIMSGGTSDIFYVEDEDLVKIVEKFMEDVECYKPGGELYKPHPIGGKKK